MPWRCTVAGGVSSGATGGLAKVMQHALETGRTFWVMNTAAKAWKYEVRPATGEIIQSYLGQIIDTDSPYYQHVPVADMRRMLPPTDSNNKET